MHFSERTKKQYEIIKLEGKLQEVKTGNKLKGKLHELKEIYKLNISKLQEWLADEQKRLEVLEHYDLDKHGSEFPILQPPSYYYADAIGSVTDEWLTDEITEPLKIERYDNDYNDEDERMDKFLKNNE
jgi:hypothetical protein